MLKSFSVIHSVIIHSQNNSIFSKPKHTIAKNLTPNDGIRPCATARLTCLGSGRWTLNKAKGKARVDMKAESNKFVNVPIRNYVFIF